MSDTAQTATTISSSVRSSFDPAAQVSPSSATTDQTVTVQPQVQVQTDTVQNQVDDNLATFDQVISEIESTVPHSVVTAIDQATDTLNPHTGVSSSKERAESTSSIDTAQFDAGAGVQTVEEERNPEIPVEVESFLQRVEDHQDSTPQEIVVADGTQESVQTQYIKKPVIVLPITQQDEQEGLKKSPRFSVRWLVEWSHKIIKMFTGKVIYKEDNSNV